MLWIVTSRLFFGSILPLKRYYLMIHHQQNDRQLDLDHQHQQLLQDQEEVGLNMQSLVLESWQLYLALARKTEVELFVSLATALK